MQKNSHMGTAKVEIAQVNAVDPNEVLAKQAELKKLLKLLLLRKNWIYSYSL